MHQQILANIASTRLPPQRSCLLLQLHTAEPWIALVSSVQQVNTYKTKPNQTKQRIGSGDPLYLPQHIFLLTDSIVARLSRSPLFVLLPF